ncbi:MAG: IMP dehydrogenase [Saprospiraceae bacterium]|nr:IMP dehydrogenase [Saprospiraceae bacterium]
MSVFCTWNHSIPIVSKSSRRQFYFEDVLLIPSYSEVLPREANVKIQFTTDIRPNAPIVSGGHALSD